MTTIISLPTTEHTPSLDAGALPFALELDPDADLFAPGRLLGESLEEFRARRDACRDIAAELLAAFTAEFAAEEVAA